MSGLSERAVENGSVCSKPVRSKTERQQSRREKSVSFDRSVFASLLVVERREGLSGCARVHQVTNPFDDVTSRVLPVVRQQLQKFPPHPP